MKLLVIAALAILPELGISQQTVPYATTAQPERKITKLVRVKYGDARTIARLAETVGRVDIRADENLRAIVVMGLPADVASAEQIIHELDVPSSTPNAKDIELTVFVIGGSGSNTIGSDIPEGIAPVVKQLRAIFPFKNYGLLSSMLLRSREGSPAQSSGTMKFGDSPNNNYSVSYDQTTVDRQNSLPAIHVHQFRFNTRFSTPVAPASKGAAVTQWTMSDVGVKTDVDLREGQKTVIGKADVGGSDSALFVVLNAKLVD